MTRIDILDQHLLALLARKYNLAQRREELKKAAQLLADTAQEISDLDAEVTFALERRNAVAGSALTADDFARKLPGGFVPPPPMPPPTQGNP